MVSQRQIQTNTIDNRDNFFAFSITSTIRINSENRLQKIIFLRLNLKRSVLIIIRQIRITTLILLIKQKSLTTIITITTITIKSLINTAINIIVSAQIK